MLKLQVGRRGFGGETLEKPKLGSKMGVPNLSRQRTALMISRSVLEKLICVSSSSEDRTRTALATVREEIQNLRDSTNKLGIDACNKSLRCSFVNN